MLPSAGEVRRRRVYPARARCSTGVYRVSEFGNETKRDLGVMSVSHYNSARGHSSIV